MRILYDPETLGEILSEEEGKRLLAAFEEAAEQVLKEEDLSEMTAEISLSLVDREEMREINRVYRETDRSTDVLSFPQYENEEALRAALAEGQRELLLGDVVLCHEVALEQAKEYGHSRERELVYLFVHSLFHLLGYDHMEEEEKALMRTKEERVMAALHLERNE